MNRWLRRWLTPAQMPRLLSVILTEQGILHKLGRCGARRGPVFLIDPDVQTVIGYLYGPTFRRYCRRCW